MRSGEFAYGLWEFAYGLPYSNGAMAYLLTDWSYILPRRGIYDSVSKLKPSEKTGVAYGS